MSVTPNRPDCLSVFGIAREAAALFNVPLRFPGFHLSETLGPIENETSVEIQAPDGCPRYTARLMDNIAIAPSPFWMREKILSAGMRPINNVVDVTNFVLLELGQPLHAFDFELLREGRIVVRFAREGERFTTLDNVERIMTDRSLMICDGEGPVALAGVMGGLNSEIRPNTRRVLLESAYFDPSTTRRTSKMLGLSTEAAYRFERGTDPEGVVVASDRASQLMADLAGARIYSGIVDVYPRPIPRGQINLNRDRLNLFLGTKFSTQEIADTLRAIQMEVDADDRGEMTAVPPSFRMDVTRDVDLYEEVARIKGLDSIPVTLPTGAPHAQPRSPLRRLRALAKDTAAATGFSEVISYSFIAPQSGDRLQLPSDDPRRPSVALLNPLSEDQAVMRTSLLPGLLTAVSRNAAFKNQDLKLFELGKVFLVAGNEELPLEPHMFSAVWTGKRVLPSWHGNAETTDFYDIKGALENVLDVLHVANASYAPLTGDAIFADGVSARLLVDGREAGVLGRIRDSVLTGFDIEAEVYAFDVRFDVLTDKNAPVQMMQSLPKYPPVLRDLVVAVPKDVMAGSVLEIIREFGRTSHLESVGLFDVYEGEKIGPGRVSLGYRIVYRAADRSLTDKEVNVFHERLMDHVVKQTGGTLRD